MKLDLKNVDLSKINDYEDKALKAFDTLVDGSGEGSDFLGWIDRPIDYDKEEFERIKKAAEKIQADSDVLVSVGIGGSYLGIKATEYALDNYFGSDRKVKVIYAGHQLSGQYMAELLDYLKDKDYSINIISKSGTTTEPAIAFRFLREALEEKYGKEEARGRIYATTDRKKGALKDLANAEGYESFVVPDDIGGRFSVISAVGLLPLAATGIEDVLILTGESEKFSSIDYIAKACQIAKRYFKVIGIEIYPANVDDYKKLRAAGADFVTVFQESYNKEYYDFYHPAGHKRSFSYRIDTQERALMGGMRGVGFGTLFGLGNPIEEAFKLGIHASLIQKKYPDAEIAISLPRIRPAKGADDSLIFKNIVEDREFFQIMLAIRIFLPYASITLSTRESRDFRNLAVKYAATKVSASVDTSIGHRSKHNQHSGGSQFEIDDIRTTNDVVEDLESIGMTPVFTDYINV